MEKNELKVELKQYVRFKSPHFVNLELEDFYIALVYIFYLAINRMSLFQDSFFLLVED